MGVKFLSHDRFLLSYIGLLSWGVGRVVRFTLCSVFAYFATSGIKGASALQSPWCWWEVVKAAAGF
jgi:hypothetical protein